MKIICLCGSTRFKPLFLKVAQEEGLRGNLVLMPTVWSHADKLILTKEQEDQLYQVHCRRIMLADVVWIICPKGYWGEGTKREIKFAEAMNKPLVYKD